PTNYSRCFDPKNGSRRYAESIRRKCREIAAGVTFTPHNDTLCMSADIHQFSLAIGGEHPRGEAGELRFKVLIAHGVFETADGMFDELVEAAATLHRDNDSDLIFVERGIHGCRHPIAHGGDRAIPNRAIAALIR